MASQEHLLEVMDAAFARAVEAHPQGQSGSFYTFAGQQVRMRIIGREMASQICRPFSHLRVEETPDRCLLTIDLWDENVTGIRCQDRELDGDLIWREVSVPSPDGRFIAHQLAHTLVCLDLEAGHMVGSLAWGEELFVYERAKPLARPLAEWHNHQGIHVVHAGLVSGDGQGLLLAGRSGSGKSTASLVCLQAGFGFASEDFVALELLPDGSFVGHSLYSSAFVETQRLGLFPDLAPHFVHGRPPYENKSVIVLSDIYGDRLRRSVPIRALAICRVTDAPQSRIRPLTKGRALQALAVSSLFQIPSPGRGGFNRLAELIERTPCVCLDLGRDLESIPRAVEEILASVSQP